MAAPKEENKIYVGIVFDWETGGLDCKKHAVTQLAMKAVRFDTFDVIAEYQNYVLPYSRPSAASQKKKCKKKNEDPEDDMIPMEYTDAALEYSGITMATIKNMGISLGQLGADIVEFIQKVTLTSGRQTKPVLIGQNVFFDVGFLQQVMVLSNMDKEYAKLLSGDTDFYGNFQPHYIDTIDLARLALAGDPTVTSYNLELICERLGIELDDAHDAMADVTATLNVVITSASRMRSGDGDDISLNKTEKTRAYFKI